MATNAQARQREKGNKKGGWPRDALGRRLPMGDSPEKVKRRTQMIAEAESRLRNADERAVQADQLRIAGVTYQAIATQLGYSTAGDAKRAIDKIALERHLMRNEPELHVFLDRNDAIRAALYSKRSDPAVAQTLIANDRLRMQVLGYLGGNRTAVEVDVRLGTGAAQEPEVEQQGPGLVEAMMQPEMQAAIIREMQATGVLDMIMRADGVYVAAPQENTSQGGDDD